MDRKRFKNHIVSCPLCGKEVLDHMTVCPFCKAALIPEGYQGIPGETIKSIRRRLNLIGMILAVAVLACTLFLRK